MSLKRFLFLFLIAAGVTWALRALIFEGIYIASASMEPTLSVGAHLFLDKITYLWREPRRGEIVVFAAPVKDQEEMVKRIIALGGDKIEIKEKAVYLNEARQLEAYVQHTRKDEKLRGDSLGPFVVPQNHVFVLGDNRDESNDSSVWPSPFVPASSIRGKLRGIY